MMNGSIHKKNEFYYFIQTDINYSVIIKYCNKTFFFILIYSYNMLIEISYICSKYKNNY